MPGIFGYFLKNPDREVIGNRIIDAISEKLNHFDFYHPAILRKGRYGIGIVDFRSNGPRIHEDPRTGTIVAIFGDVFDFIGLDPGMERVSGQTLEEFIITLYLRFGHQLPEKLNGDYNIFVMNPGKGNIILFNDRFGFRHLYYYEDENIFLFSPELKAFSCYEGFDKKVNDAGLADYLNYSYQLGDKTMFSRVKLLPPGSSIRVEGGALEVNHYWEPKYTLLRGLADIEESVDTGHKLFVQSMARRVKGRKNLVVPLSGGLDSRLSIAVAKDLGCDITAVTFGSRNCLDYQIAKKVCNLLGIGDHRFVEIRPDWFFRHGEKSLHLIDSNYGILGPASLYGFYEEIGNRYDGLLNGIFGGHLSFGSPYFGESKLTDDSYEQKILEDIIQGLEGHRYIRVLQEAATPRTNELAKEHRIRSVKEEWGRTRNSASLVALRQDNLFLYNRIRRGMNNLDLNRFFYNSLLPFSSYELYDFYLTLKPELTLKHYLYKSIFRKELPRLAAIPWQSTGVNLYEEQSKFVQVTREFRKYFIWYVTRITQGTINMDNTDTYVQEDNHYRRSADLRNWVEKIILSERCIDRGLFRKDGMERILVYQKKGGSVFQEIGKLVGLELWFQKNVD